MAETSYNYLLALTVLESFAGFSVAIVHQINLTFLGFASPEVNTMSDFSKNLLTGYGFWAGAWFIAAYLMIDADIAMRKRFARFATFLYIAWWFLFSRTIFDGTWHAYILVIFIIVRLVQPIGHLLYGFVLDAKSKRNQRFRQ